MQKMVVAVWEAQLYRGFQMTKRNQARGIVLTEPSVSRGINGKQEMLMVLHHKSAIALVFHPLARYELCGSPFVLQ